MAALLGAVAVMIALASAIALFLPAAFFASVVRLPVSFGENAGRSQCAAILALRRVAVIGIVALSIALLPMARRVFVALGAY